MGICTILLTPSSWKFYYLHMFGQTCDSKGFTMLVAKEKTGMHLDHSSYQACPPPIPNFLWLQIIFLKFRKLSLQLVNLGAPPPQLKKKIYREINIIINLRIEVLTTLLPPPSPLRIRILKMVFFIACQDFFISLPPAPPLSKTMSDCYLQNKYYFHLYQSIQTFED